MREYISKTPSHGFITTIVHRGQLAARYAKGYKDMADTEKRKREREKMRQGGKEIQHHKTNLLEIC